MSPIRRPLLATLALVPLAACAGPTQVPLPTGEVPAIEETIASERALSLQAGSETRLYRTEQRPPKGTIVMYHGMTAGTWQYELLAKRFQEAGYHAYVPRMPGHGLKDAEGKPDSSQMPLTSEYQRYMAYGEETYQQARALGAPIHVMGLSVGGNVALYVAEQHPEVKSVVAFAPFLRVKTGSGVFDSAYFLDNVLFGAGGGTLDRLNHGWGTECEADEAAGKRAGHCNFKLGNINSAMRLGGEVIALAPQLKSPTQFFVTATDDAADEAAIKQVYEQAGGAARNGWYYYPAEEGIPHPMLHPAEDKGKGHTPALYDMTVQFVETLTPVNRPMP